MLPCAYKSLFGIDCPACGIQRSLLALLKGDFRESFFIYPPLIFVLIGIIAGLVYLIKPQIIKPVLLKRYFTFLLAIVLVNYVIHLAS